MLDLLAFLAPRCVAGVEEVEGTVYRRAVGDGVASIDLASGAVTGDERIRRMTGPEPGDADAVLANALRPVFEPGTRVPGTTDPAEIAVRAVLGQQVSVAAARTLAGRLTKRLGAPLAHPVGGVTHAFPRPAALAGVAAEDLPMPRARGRALVGLARALADGMPVERDALLALPGIGPWTADYVALRTGDPDVLLLTDLGVRHALKRLGIADGAALREACRPYGSFATILLWRSLSAPVSSWREPSGGESRRAET